MDRTVLPIPDKPYAGPVYEDAKDPRAVYEPIRPVSPPPGAPNVLVILLDDVGFGAASVFGGPCRTPTAERLAGNGLSYSRFHTAALCAPTRQALLTGRNHHAVGMGAITEVATSIPGYTSVRPQSAAPLAEVLRLNGYATAQFGKCHEVPMWQTSPVGPFDAWPTGGGGFEHFFGFLGGETNQFAPALYNGTTPIEPDRTADEDYHFTEDMTDRAIAWVRQQSALAPDRPFFMYFAPGATHAPHHVPLEWADKYRGQFDDGWDALRERTFAEQQRRGIVPEDAELTARHDEIPAWDDMPDELKPVLARQMEVYAGFLEHTDHHIGRLVDALDAIHALDNTLVFYILGDNGASAEGHINGSFNEYLFFNGAAALETPEFLASRIDLLGTPQAYNHFSVGWAHAMDTPYQWTKQVASHWGGTRNATVVHWPAGISEPGQVRHQFHHVIDIAPTVLDVAGLPHPDAGARCRAGPAARGEHALLLRRAARRRPAHHPVLRDRRKPRDLPPGVDRGHQARDPVDRDGRTARLHRRRVGAVRPRGLDPGQRPRGDQMPEKLQELQELFLSEARTYNVLPLDDRRVERFDAKIAGRPELISGRSQILYGGMGRLTESSRDQHEERLPRGGRRRRDPRRWRIRGDRVPRRRLRRMEPLPARRRHPRLLLQPDGHAVHHGRRFPAAGSRAGDASSWCSTTTVADPAAAAASTLKVDGETVAEGRLEATVPLVFSLDETCDVGHDTGSPVSDDYRSEDSAFTGTVDSVLFEIAEGATDFSHLVDPQLRLSTALARQ